MKFCFLIPFRNRSTAQNWSTAIDLCLSTVSSALCQTAPVKVILVCNEFPTIIDQPNNLVIVQGDFPDPATPQAQRVDKREKLQRGLVELRRLGDLPSYIMKLDADDLVHSDLAETALSHSNANGYFVQSGYRWDPERRWGERRDDFLHRCGSSWMIPCDADSLPKSMGDRWENFDLLALGHQEVADAFAQRGKPLEPIPFPAVIARRGHGENISQISPLAEWGTGSRPNWKWYAGRLLSSLAPARNDVKEVERVLSSFLPEPKFHAVEGYAMSERMRWQP
ncbi:MAG: hypothetical protein V2J51_08890 [Erythrobacter sp.]|nr:hypothetical protein [Erythrobacter sp.]